MPILASFLVAAPHLAQIATGGVRFVPGIGVSAPFPLADHLCADGKRQAPADQKPPPRFGVSRQSGIAWPTLLGVAFFAKLWSIEDDSPRVLPTSTCPVIGKGAAAVTCNGSLAVPAGFGGPLVVALVLPWAVRVGRADGPFNQ